MSKSNEKHKGREEGELVVAMARLWGFMRGP